MAVRRIAALGKKMAIEGIDTVAIVVSDRRKALKWYRDVLGLPVAYVPPNAGHWIELGPGRPRTRVHLCEMGSGTEPGPTGITFLTDDALSDHARMIEKGVKFRSLPKKMDWGEWLCEFEDPDGNVFDLKQPVDPRRWREG